MLATFSSGREANLATAAKVLRKDGVSPGDGVRLVVAHHDECCFPIRVQTCDQTSCFELKMGEDEHCIILLSENYELLSINYSFYLEPVD